MDNCNDLPAHITCLEIPDEKHDSNKYVASDLMIHQKLIQMYA